MIFCDSPPDRDELSCDRQYHVFIKVGGCQQIDSHAIEQ